MLTSVGGYFVTIAGALSARPRPDITQSHFVNSETNLESAPLLAKLVPHPPARPRQDEGSYRSIWICLAHSGLLYDSVRLDESFPMGPCSTTGDG
jgi:hypothetical protein